MQNVQEPITSTRITDVGKSSVEGTTITGSELSKKLRDSQPQDIECRVSRVTSDRDRTLTSNTAYHCDKQLKISIIADKYQLFEQVEGSSLYRCIDVNTREELVCKVSLFIHSFIFIIFHFVYSCLD